MALVTSENKLSPFFLFKKIRKTTLFSPPYPIYIYQEEGEKENNKPDKVGPGAVIAQQAAEVNFTPDKDADIISPCDNDNAFNR